MNETLEFMPAGGTAVAKATDVVSVITQFNALQQGFGPRFNFVKT